MPDWITIALGVLLLVLGTADQVWTTLVLDGAGPLTSRLSTAVWRVFQAVHRRWPSHRLLQAGATLILLAAFATWILLAWIGWSLIFVAGDASVLNSATGTPASPLQRVYFTGYTLFTLGQGNFSPKGWFWELATDIACLHGLVLTTLSITYLVPVVSAGAQQRQLAIRIMAGGSTPAELLLRSWDGERFEGLADELRDLVSLVSLQGPRHLAYPVLHYFHSELRHRSVALALAVLDEAVTTARFGVAPEARPQRLALETAQGVITDYLLTLRSAFVTAAEEPPPPPDRGPLRSAGVPLADDDSFAGAISSLRERRALLRGLVEQGGWEWREVAQRPPTTALDRL